MRLLYGGLDSAYPPCRVIRHLMWLRSKTQLTDQSKLVQKIDRPRSRAQNALPTGWQRRQVKFKTQCKIKVVRAKLLIDRTSRVRARGKSGYKFQEPRVNKRHSLQLKTDRKFRVEIPLKSPVYFWAILISLDSLWVSTKLDSQFVNHQIHGQKLAHTI